MPDAPPAIDLRALIRDRKAKDARASVRVTICFDPDLLAALQEAQAEKASIQRGDQPEPDARLGRPNPTAELEAAVAAASVVAVFRVPTRERQAELNDLAEAGEDIDPLLASETFAHFLRGNEPIPSEELGRGDFEDWLAVASRGEVNDIAFKVATRSMSAPDFPSSVKKSLATR